MPSPQTGASSPRVNWADLPPGAKAFRVAHTVWAAISMAGLGCIWWSVLTGRRDRRVVASVAWLAAEGAALVVGRGNCPFGPAQRRLGDPVPLFELLLPPRAAKAAVPVLLVITLAGMAGLIVGPRPRAPM